MADSVDSKLSEYEKMKLRLAVMSHLYQAGCPVEQIESDAPRMYHALFSEKLWAMGDTERGAEHTLTHSLSDLADLFPNEIAQIRKKLGVTA